MSRKQIAFKDDAEDHIHQHCPPGIWLWVRPTQDRILGASESHGQEGFVETEKPLCIYCTHSHTCAHICTDIRTHTRLNLSRQMAVNCVGRRALRWPRATFQSSICFISSPRSLRFQVEPERKPWRELHISEGKVGVGAARAKLGPKFMTLSFPTPNSLRTLPKRKGGTWLTPIQVFLMDPESLQSSNLSLTPLLALTFLVNQCPRPRAIWNMGRESR